MAVRYQQSCTSSFCNMLLCVSRPLAQVFITSCDTGRIRAFSYDVDDRPSECCSEENPPATGEVSRDELSISHPGLDCAPRYVEQLRDIGSGIHTLLLYPFVGH